MKNETLQLASEKQKHKKQLWTIISQQTGQPREIDKFLARYNLSEDIENLNRSIMNKDCESVIKNFSTKKILGPDGWWILPNECHFFPKSFQKTFRRGGNSFKLILWGQHYPTISTDY